MTSTDALADTPELTATAPVSNTSTEIEVEHESPNFDLVVMHYYACQGEEAGADARAAYRDVLMRWQAREGNIASSYFCENIKAAVVTTDQDRLFSVGDPYRQTADLPLYHLITRATHLEQFVEESLVGAPRRASIAELYAIETNALACMDELGAKPPPPREVAKELRNVTQAKMEADLSHAETYAHSAWQRRAQIAYLQGMGLGVIGVAVAVAAAALLLAPLLSAWPAIPPRISYVPWALLLGAIGAVLSVMQRLTQGKLRLRLDTNLTQIRTLGAFRPVIGSAFALGVVILVLGGLIPLQLPAQDDVRPFFVAGLAFLAGFSERFAQDMIGIGATQASPAANDQSTDEKQPPT